MEMPFRFTRRFSKSALTSKQGPWSKLLGEEKAFVKVTRVTNVNLEFQTYMELYAREAQFGKLLDIPIRALDGHELTEPCSTRSTIRPAASPTIFGSRARHHASTSISASSPSASAELGDFWLRASRHAAFLPASLSAADQAQALL